MRRTYLKLKACTKCGGDMLVDRTFEDADICIQCGFRKFRKTVHRMHSQSQLKHTVTVAKRQSNSKVVAKA